MTDLPRAGENPANPGVVAEAKWTFNDGRRTWEEPMDLIKTLAAVLEDRGHGVLADGPVLIDRDSQLSFRPLMESMEPVHENGVRTTTTIEIKHPFRIAQPVFEFQHSSGPNLEASIRDGFGQWYDCDFIALRDAIREDPIDCQEIYFPVEAEGRAGQRRVTLGPVLHYQEQEPSSNRMDNDHCFCPCCLFTNSIDAFRPLLASGGFHALRLFAMRNAIGHIDADCRVNGEDYDPGKQSLIRYATNWMPAGVEFRKQYVVIQNIPS